MENFFFGIQFTTAKTECNSGSINYGWRTTYYAGDQVVATSKSECLSGSINYGWRTTYYVNNQVAGTSKSECLSGSINYDWRTTYYADDQVVGTSKSECLSGDVGYGWRTTYYAEEMMIGVSKSECISGTNMNYGWSEKNSGILQNNFASSGNNYSPRLLGNHPTQKVEKEENTMLLQKERSEDATCNCTII